MPYRTVWEPEGVLWRFWGAATGQELLQSNLDIYGDSRFDDIRYEICDFLDVTTIDLDERDLRKVAHLDLAAAKTNPRIKVAVVTNRDLIKGYTNMYAAYVGQSPWETQFFATMAEARDWIDADVAS
jgi:hypothetical protein